jgi:threonine synthase
VRTLANAMDVGDPSNAARIFALYGHDWKALTADISGSVCIDAQIRDAMRRCREQYGYQLDPHGACGFHAVYHHLAPGESALLCETAHPAKFKETVEAATGAPVEIPSRLAAFMQGSKQSVPMGRSYPEFKAYLSEIQ